MATHCCFGASFCLCADSHAGAPLAAIHLKDQRIVELNKWLSERMLRREKSIIQDQLPKKEDNVVFCKLSDTQVRS